MSRNKPSGRGGIKLPFALQKELGIENTRKGHGRRGGKFVSARDRKEFRKADRLDKRNFQSAKGHQRHDQESPGGSEDYDESEDDSPDDEPKQERSRALSKPEAAPTMTVTPKSILKKPTAEARRIPPTSNDKHRETSPGLTFDPNSRAYKDRIAQDEADIASLEKKLGLKDRKTPKAFADDGLDNLLEGLENGWDEKKKRKRDADEWLENKRRKAAGLQNDSEDDDLEDSTDEEDLSELSEDELEDSIDLVGEDGDEDDIDGGEDKQFDMDKFVANNVNDHGKERGTDRLHSDGDDNFEGFDTESNADAQPDLKSKQQTRMRENPYTAPIQDQGPVQKYVPPSLRKAQGGDEEARRRLDRTIQGLLNKLSEANLVSMVNDTEKVYREHPRQDVHSALVGILLSLFSDRSTLQNTFVILHAAFTAAVYKIIGTDFGAELLSKLIQRFDEYRQSTFSGKECLNLLSLLSNLFTFNVVGSAIIFDQIKLLLQDLSEGSTELLLRLVKDCGPQLRSDDPSALKSIVQIMQKAASERTDQGQQLSVRTKFMMETITDLKNNKIRVNHAGGQSNEHITQMRKVLGSLNSRSIRATEPLRITLDDIKNSDKKGKWWLVGASWRGNDVENISHNDANFRDVAMDEESDSNEVDLSVLAKQYRVNTDIRRSIFVSLMSALDFHDAYARLTKLRLKRSQEQEISKVLLRCTRAEQAFNPYYSLVARQLCSEKRMRKSFQFALWDFFRSLGEKGGLADDEAQDDDEEDESDALELHEIANVAQLYALLILERCLTLDILKVLNIGYLKEKATLFVELLLVTVLIKAKSEDQLVRVFTNVGPASTTLRLSLSRFLKKTVAKSDLASKSDKSKLRDRCHLARECLAREPVEIEVADVGKDDID